MNRITISLMAVIVMAMAFIGISKKAEAKQPPNLEQAWSAFSATTDAKFYARNHNGDTATARVNWEVAFYYLKSNWTVAQISSYVDEKWPTYQQVQANCLMHC